MVGRAGNIDTSTVDHLQYEPFSITRSYFHSLFDCEMNIKSLALKVTFLAAPIIAFITLFTDLYLAIVYCLSEQNVTVLDAQTHGLPDSLRPASLIAPLARTRDPLVTGHTEKKEEDIELISPSRSPIPSNLPDEMDEQYRDLFSSRQKLPTQAREKREGLQSASSAAQRSSFSTPKIRGNEEKKEEDIELITQSPSIASNFSDDTGMDGKDEHLYSSSSDLTLNFASQINSYSPKAKKLLNITSDLLTKKGFDSNPWIDYLTISLQPIYQDMMMLSLEFEKSHATYNKSISAELKFINDTFNTLTFHLRNLPANGKAWRKMPGKTENAAIFLEILIAKITITTNQESFLDLIGEKEFTSLTEGTSILNHLFHLLLTQMSVKLSPNNENYMVILNKQRSWLAIKELGIWKFGMVFNPKSRSPTFHAWQANTKDSLLQSVLIKNGEVIPNTPFIGVKLALNANSSEVQNALRDKKRFEFIPNHTFLNTHVVYSNQSLNVREEGNALFFQESTGILDEGAAPNSLLSSNIQHEKKNYELMQFLYAAMSSIQQMWIKKIQEQPLEIFYSDYIYTFPTSEEEAYDRMLDTLNIASNNPTENALLIEYIAEQFDFDYSEEDLQEARVLHEVPLADKDTEIVEELAAPLTGIPAVDKQMALKEISITPAVMAHAVLQKLKKQRPDKHKPLAQQPTNRRIPAATQAAASSSSSKRKEQTNEEVIEKIKRANMDPKLRERATDLLSGERLSSKREEDKFFLDILSYQAKSSGCTVQKGNKGGSHHSIRLVRQSKAGEKITYRAATLVNKHGADANRGHSLAVQQDKLHRLFTPLVR